MQSIRLALRRRDYISDPNLSLDAELGPFHHKVLGALHIQTMWSVKFGSPVWDDCLQMHNEVLYMLGHHNRLHGPPPPGLTLALLGDDCSRVKPIFLLTSPNKHLRRTARDCIYDMDEWKPFKERHPGFEVKISSRIPTLLGSSASPMWFARSAGKLQHTLGSAIDFVDANHAKKSQPFRQGATLGPRLIVGDKELIVTVAHSIGTGPNLGDTEASEDEDCLDDSSDDDEGEFISFNSFGYENKDTTTTSSASRSHQKHSSGNAALYHAVSQYTRDSAWEHPLRSETGKHNQLQPSYQTSETTYSESRFEEENAPVFAQVISTSPNHDWCLLREERYYPTQQSGESKSTGDSDEVPNPFTNIRAFGTVPNEKVEVVVIVAGRQPITGTLLSSVSHHRFSDAKGFTRVVNLRTSIPLRKGDCGSAVIGLQDNVWYGHIIAAYGETDLNLVVPASDIVQGIADQMDLPTSKIEIGPRRGSRPNVSMEHEAIAKDWIFVHSSKVLSEGDDMSTRITSYHVNRGLQSLYQPLKENEIRLMSINYDYDELVLDLSTTELPSLRRVNEQDVKRRPKSPYTALSYHWSPADSGEFVTVVSNDRLHELKLSHSLLDFLSAWKSNRTGKSVSQDNSYFWIDACCINREDNSELGHQLSLMSAIYRNASETLVWLGNPDDSLRKIVTIIDDLEDVRSPWIKDQRAIGTREISTFADLLHRPWFSRIWIIQELSFSRKTSLFINGTTISWSRMVNAVHTCVAAEEKLSFRFSTRSITNSVALRQINLTQDSLVQITDRGTVEKRRMSLAQLADTFSYCQCSDPRDTIYSILSLAYDARPKPYDHYDCWCLETRQAPSESTRQIDMFPSFESPLIELGLLLMEVSTNYSVQLDQLHLDMTEHEIRRTKSLDVLTMSWHRASSSSWSLPSWLPRDPLRTSHDGRLLQARGIPFAAKASSSTVQFIHETTREFLVLRDKPVSLWADALSIGLVTRVGEIALDGVVPIEWTHFGQDQGTNTFVTLLEEILKTQQIFQQSLDSKRQQQLLWLMMRDPRGWDINHRKLRSKWTVSEQVVALAERIRQTIYNRPLIVVRYGNSIDLALAEKEVDAGDIVCILYGCSVPVVLHRESDDAWKFKGTCFILGLMNGELTSWIQKHSLRKERFRLV